MEQSLLENILNMFRKKIAGIMLDYQVSFDEAKDFVLQDFYEKTLKF